jgi:hypothetical protein
MRATMTAVFFAAVFVSAVAGILFFAVSVIGISPFELAVYFALAAIGFSIAYKYRGEGYLVLLFAAFLLGWMNAGSQLPFVGLILFSVVSGTTLRGLIRDREETPGPGIYILLLLSLIAAVSCVTTCGQYLAFEPKLGIANEGLQVNAWGVTVNQAVRIGFVTAILYFSWGVLLFLSSRIDFSENRKDQTKLLLSILFGVNALAALFQAGAALFFVDFNGGVFGLTASGLMGSPEVLGLAGAFTLSFFPLIFRESPRRRLLDPLILAAAAVCVILSGFAPAAVYLLFVYIPFLTIYLLSKNKPFSRRLFQTITAITCFLIIFLVAAQYFDSEGNNLPHFGKEASFFLRNWLSANGRAMEMLAAYPAAGAGVGSLAIEGGNADLFFGTAAEAGLSTIFKTAAELGLAGVVIFLAGLATLGASVVARSAGTEGGRGRSLFIVPFLGLFALLLLGDYFNHIGILIILCFFLGAAATSVQTNVRSNSEHRFAGTWLMLGCLIVPVIFGVISVLSARSLESEWQEWRWPIEAGFYPPEKGETDFSWTEPVAVRTVTPDRRFLHIQWRAETIDSPSYRPMVSFTLDDRVLDKRAEFNPGRHHSFFPVTDEGSLTKLLVIRTEPPFIPDTYLHNGDKRKLGIAIARLDFVDELPEESYGFWGWEEGDGREFQWSQAEAYRRVPLNAGLLKFAIRAAHPDIEEQPVTVIYSLNGALEGGLTLSDRDWHEVTVDPARLPASARPDWHGSLAEQATGFLRIEVSRTWRPSQVLKSEDSRMLGVAVSKVKAAGENE